MTDAAKLPVCAGIVLAVLKLLLWIAEKDENPPCVVRKVSPCLCLLCLMSAEAVFLSGTKCLKSENAGDISELLTLLLLSIIAGCLLMACVTDCESCTVYNYVWWVGGAAGVFLRIGTFPEQYGYSAGQSEEMVRSILQAVLQLMLIGWLQEILFCRMYGKADCHGFLICGLAECAMGLGLKEHLIQMLLAVSLLAVIQGKKRNIQKNGNLKKPVPFLPYITLSFWLVLIFL